MSTTPNPPSGAMQAQSDPFTGSPTHAHPGPTRYAAFDNEQFSTYSTNSPSQAKRALEAHLKDTERRLEDASKLGKTLLQQRKDLTTRLEEVKQVSQDNEVPQALKQKLADLEREYNEVGKESARAFLPKPRVVGEPLDPNVRTAVFTSSGRESPTKVTAPSRRARNQPTNRTHDIEFATEISTQLLAQVRQLQTALAEKDDSLKDVAADKARLESDSTSMMQRIRQMDESAQRYKDANWELETKLQDLESTHREVSDSKAKQGNTLKAAEVQRAITLRELEELKSTHAILVDDHAKITRQQDADLHSLRRDVAAHESERTKMQRQIDEVKSQNTELAKAMASTWRSNSRQETDRDVIPVGEEGSSDGSGVIESDPGSPMKGTPARNGMLESETLKSSLNHAHRMIQNLKNNIHREKTEKIELRRMLTEARDELESKRDLGSAAQPNTGRKRSSRDQEGIKFKKPDRPSRLGASRSSQTEIFEDEPDWEDDGEARTPSKAVLVGAGSAAAAAAFDHQAFDNTDSEAAFQTANESEEFETATEREGMSTETDAFHTGAESMAGDSSEELTETEGNFKRSGTIIGKSASPSYIGAKARDRASFVSTASTSGDEDDEVASVRTPQQNQQPRYRLRVGRGNRRSRGPSGIFLDSPQASTNSPSASVSSTDGTPRSQGQNLGDELDGLDDDSVEGTPSKLSSVASTPDEAQRMASEEPEGARDISGDDLPDTPTKQASAVPLPEGGDDEDHEPEISSPVLSPKPAVPEGEQALLAYQSNAAMLAHERTKARSNMVDAGMMTDPWEPEKIEVGKEGLRGRAAEVVGGALAGIGLGKYLDRKKGDKADAETNVAASNEEDAVAKDVAPASPPHADEPALEVPQAQKERPLTAIMSDEMLGEQAAADVEPKAQAEPINLQHAGIVTQETEPIAPEPYSPQRPVTPDRTVAPASGLQRLTDTAKFGEASPPRAATRRISQALAFSPVVAEQLEPVEVPKEQPKVEAVPVVHSAEPKPSFMFSPLVSNQVGPAEMAAEVPRSPATPLLPKRSSKRLDTLFSNHSSGTTPEMEGPAVPGTESSPPGVGFFASLLPAPLRRSRSKSVPASARQVDPLQPDLVRGSMGPNGIPMLTFGDDAEPATSNPATDMAPLVDFPTQLGQHKYSTSNGSMLPIMKPLQVKRPTMDDGAQTMLSGADIENIMRSRSRPTTAVPVPAPTSPTRSPRRSAEMSAVEELALLKAQLKRPSSAGSNRTKAILPTPPLPPDHSEKIAAAQKSPPISAPGIMGPPIMPASAYKGKRPVTPSLRGLPGTRDGTTPRPRASIRSERPSEASQRTSVSSFESEVEERFRTGHNVMYPDDVTPSTDPRMIHAITQTMIGEYLWKYTRKAGRSEVSNTRHRRFFWIHPYTRTLYWSEKDPSTAGRDMLKAKSVSIQSVRVVTDDNAYPPGLHRKSVVIVTPGREIVFTAPTGQRHETWFNALSYLLLRTEQEKAEATDGLNEEDLHDFNPNAGFLGRSISRMTRRSRSRTSLSSYNSRTTRASSPHMHNSLAHRQSQAVKRSRGSKNVSPSPQRLPTPDAGATATGSGTVTSQRSVRRVSSAQGGAGSSTGGRLNSLTAAFRAPGGGSKRGSFSSRPGATSALSNRSTANESTGIYDASVVGEESAEDLRAVIERQERDADRLENVRACCDGKHDVGSLSRNKRHASFSSRLGGGGAAGGHSHSHPRV